MKQSIQLFAFVATFAALAMTNSCSKTPTTSTTTSTQTGKFTCLIGSESFSAPDAYLLNGAGGTLGCIAKDSKNRKFEISIFKDSFPVNITKDISWATALAYTNENGKIYVAKSGTMTVTSYGLSTSGTVNNMKGRFAMTGIGSGQEVVISEGVFDISTK